MNESYPAGPSALIDRFMPAFDMSEHHEAFVRAPAPVAYGAMLRLDLARSRVTLVLLAFRGLFALAQPREARRLYGPRVRRPRLTLGDLQEAGFVVLGEQPGKEVVLGVVGRFWQPGSGIRRVQAPAFVSWNEPGYGKAVLNFAVRPAPDGSVVSTETRVRCTDERARRAFRRYWRVIGPFSGLIRGRALALVKAEAERPVLGNNEVVGTGTIDEEV